MAVRTLADTYAPIEGLYVNAEYRERPDYRFVHDAKPHCHDRLAATMPAGTPRFALRHWTIQDMFDSAYVRRMLRLAALYGMNGIQFSGDNIYWVNDSLHRYNTYAFVGTLCEQCHDLGLKAYFWTHEINGFFHEFVTDGKYGYSGQLAAGTMDLSSTSGYWDVLRDKYDVFFRRMPGVDGLVLTLNECHVPVFRERCIRSDLPARERVARIARILFDVCRAHGKHLILRTFCYEPGELATIREGVDMIDRDVTLMMKCQPHDWQIYYPHNPLIAEFRDRDTVVEYDLALEFMGDGRHPAPQLDYLRYRFGHAADQAANGVSGRICRFRNHAEHTLNWANVYAFSRLAHSPETAGDTLWQDYAAADYGPEAAGFVVDLGRRLFRIAEQTYHVAREQRGLTNYNTFPGLDNWLFWNCAKWSPDDPEVVARYRAFCAPTPPFIEQVVREKEAALADARRLCEELPDHRGELCAEDYAYLETMLDRVGVIAEVHMTQHVVEVMVRHDARRPAAGRRYGGEIAQRLARLRELVRTKRQLVLDASAEGNQHNDALVEVFCRRAERYLAGGATD